MARGQPDLEAARVAAERGHDVTIIEAASAPGGQVRLISRLTRRRDMIGLIDWRISECERLGVDLRYDTYAECNDVTELDPDVVLIATGGIPNTDILEEGAEFAVVELGYSVRRRQARTERTRVR